MPNNRIAESEITRLVAAGMLPANMLPIGKARANRHKPIEVRTAVLSESSWVVVLVPSCRVVSEANRSRQEHWSQRAKRFKAQKEAVRFAWGDSPIGAIFTGCWADGWFPLRVTLSHIGPRMDDDNLAGSFKGVRDQIAKCIGVDDGSDKITWKYEQELGTPGIRVRLERVA